MDFKCALACLAGAMCTPLVTVAAEGDLDSAFGAGGIALIGIAKPYPAAATRPVSQPDGKIVLCDDIPDAGGAGEHFAVARFNANGSLDTGFGTDGRVVIDGGSETCLDVAVQSDGRIIVVGDYYADPAALPAGFLVVRLNSDGSPDTSFGDGNGRTSVYFGASSSEYSAAVGVRVRSDGRIVVAGPTSTTSLDKQFAVAQLLADGQLDMSFGSGGKATVTFDDVVGMAVKDHPTSLALDREGRIVIGGFSYTTTPVGPARFAVARLAPDGSSDATFGDGGRATVAFSTIPEESDVASDMVVQRDGRIIIAGRANLAVAGLENADMAIARLQDDGALDPTFGGGRVRVAFDADGVSTDVANAVAVQDDGRIVLAGHSGAHPALARIMDDGTLDVSFGEAGKKVHDLPGTAGYAYFTGVRFDRGRLLASGETATTDQEIYDGFVADLEVDLIFSDALE